MLFFLLQKNKIILTFIVLYGQIPGLNLFKKGSVAVLQRSSV